MSTEVYDPEPPNPGLLPYRVGQLESFRRDTELWRRLVDEDRTSLEYIRRDIKTIKNVAISLLVAFVTSGISIVAVYLSAKP